MTTGEFVRALKAAGFKVHANNSSRILEKNGVKSTPLPLHDNYSSSWYGSALRNLLRRAAEVEIKRKPPLRYAEVGLPVRARIDFRDVPKGAAGIVDGDYGTGIIVKWNGTELRDSFDKATELRFLEAA